MVIILLLLGMIVLAFLLYWMLMGTVLNPGWVFFLNLMNNFLED